MVTSENFRSDIDLSDGHIFLIERGIMKDYKIGNLKIEIYQDDLAESPRECDNITEMLCCHPRYVLGDTHNYNNPSEIKESIKEGDIVLPLTIYDHSGISLSVGQEYPYNCPYDASQVGLLIVRAEKIRELDLTKENIKEIVDSEIKIYNQYLSGEVYGYNITEKCCTCDSYTKEIDNCSGYYSIGDMIDEMNLTSKEKEELRELVNV